MSLEIRIPSIRIPISEPLKKLGKNLERTQRSTLNAVSQFASITATGLSNTVERVTHTALVTLLILA